MIYIVTNDDLTDLVLNQMDEVEQILQNVAVILNTWKGSVPLHRDFGLDPVLLHKPINVVEDQIIADVIDTIEKYEPRAEVQEVSMDVAKDTPDKLKITVKLEINGGAESETEVVS